MSVLELGSSIQSAPRRRAELQCHELDDEAVLYDPTFGTTYRLNGTAYRLWRACDGTTNVEGLTAVLIDRYDVAPEAARADVIAGLAQMQRDGLLVDEGDSSC